MTNKLILILPIVALAMIAATAEALDPTATAFPTPADVTKAGGGMYSFTIRYVDDGEINVFSIDDHDVRVTGPGGFNVAATFVSSSTPFGTTVDAIYSIVPPGGSWDSSDNGTYTLVMQANQVFDGIGNSVKPGDLGSFKVNVSGSTPPSRAQLLNISTRMRVQSGDNVLIGGFIVTGSDPKKVIVRAIAPSLPVPGKLANPTLELVGPSGIIATNDNWMDAPNKQAIIDSTLAPTNDLESAILTTLPARNASYTAIVRGVGDTTGVALIEVYDLDQPADSQLANISTRGVVKTDDDVMIGGFILGPDGAGAANVLLRALGPSLSQAGVSGVLANPVLDLRNADGDVVMTNDNWKSDQQAAIEATGIPPENDLESAMVATLPPAAYTAIVSGKNGGTGVGLVELYRLP